MSDNGFDEDEVESVNNVNEFQYQYQYKSMFPDPEEKAEQRKKEEKERTRVEKLNYEYALKDIQGSAKQKAVDKYINDWHNFARLLAGDLKQKVTWVWSTEQLENKEFLAQVAEAADDRAKKYAGLFIDELQQVVSKLFKDEAYSNLSDACAQVQVVSEENRRLRLLTLRDIVTNSNLGPFFVTLVATCARQKDILNHKVYTRKETPMWHQNLKKDIRDIFANYKG